MENDEWKELVELNGDQVMMNEPVCLIHKADHKNCAGCPSELGCGKLCKLMLNTVTASMYNPTSFEDYENLMTKCSALQNKILSSKTVQELKDIPTI
jgi:hypothetical protein